MHTRFFLLLMYLVAPLCCANQLIPADNKHLQYSGRIDFSTPTIAGISWPASQVVAVISGNEIGVTLDDQYGKNYFNVFIDNNWDAPYVIACEQGLQTYQLSQYLPAGKHTITLTKRTEGEEGRTIFHGFNIADDGKIFDPPPKPQRKIEFYGDSITSGMGNEAAYNADDALLSEKNSFLSYAAITARELGADYRIISQSGIGVMVSWFDFIMPQFYDQLDAVGNNESHWDFALWQPDVVVINLFQNDSWLVEKRLKPVPNDAHRIAAYQDFIAKIRKVYPKATVIATLGNMDATKQGSAWPGYIRKAVANHKKISGDTHITTFFFPYEEYPKHPRVIHHQQNAERLTQFIRKTMKW
ncbi:GDSL-like lipase/acylhydrolase family protein [Alteromonadaceae bacterium 2753L.S.0a.02]|nr:GDSL-like lipase/acylhydrolase family protein [Alteromonadaceae bacterium 2753L.S.0a.02]